MVSSRIPGRKVASPFPPPLGADGRSIDVAGASAAGLCVARLLAGRAHAPAVQRLARRAGPSAAGLSVARLLAGRAHYAVYLASLRLYRGIISPLAHCNFHGTIFSHPHARNAFFSKFEKLLDF